MSDGALALLGTKRHANQLVANGAGVGLWVVLVGCGSPSPVGAIERPLVLGRVLGRERRMMDG